MKTAFSRMHERLQQWFQSVLPYQLTYIATVHMIDQIGVESRLAETVISVVFCFLFHGTSFLIPLSVSCGFFVLIRSLKSIRCETQMMKWFCGIFCVGVLTLKIYWDDWPLRKVNTIDSFKLLTLLGTLPKSSYFSVKYTFRYTLMRCFSYCIDTIEEDIDMSEMKFFQEFRCVVAYIAFFPTYLYGPLIPYSQFSKHWRKKKHTGCTLLILKGISSCIGQSVAYWILSNVVYKPDALSDPALNVLSYCLTVKLFLVVSFLESHIPFTLSWLCSNLRGVQAPMDTPISYFKCTSSVHNFCRHFHTTWHNWLVMYIYIPARGALFGTGLSFLVSLALHDFERHWCVLAALGGFLFFLEKMTCALKLRSVYLVQCLVQTLTESIVLPVLPGFSFKKYMFFTLINACFLYFFKSTINSLELLM